MDEPFGTLTASEALVPNGMQMVSVAETKVELGLALTVPQQLVVLGHPCIGAQKLTLAFFLP